MLSVAARTDSQLPMYLEDTRIPTLHTAAKDLAQNPLVKAIIQTEAFTRLKNISFLGALDHLATTHKLNKTTRTRADHSLHVAALASIIAEKRNYPEELKQHLIVAGLLHDIGHPPLSHSVEPYLLRQFGYGHHQIGEMLIDGKVELSKELHQILSGKLDTAFIKNLIAGDIEATHGGDLFSSRFNIDTIEGITRCSQYISRSHTALNPITVAFASFIETSEQRYRILDNFWQQKHFIYNQLILADTGLLADQYSQYYFETAGMDEADIFSTEAQWQKKHRTLFANLNQTHSKSDLPEQTLPAEIRYTKRDYWIYPDKTGRERYSYQKEPTTLKLAKLKQTRPRQTELFSF